MENLNEIKYKIEHATLDGIANAIRSKTGTTDSILVSNFATKIEEIETGTNLLGYREFNSNGIYDAPLEGYSGYASVYVNVPTTTSGNLADKIEITPTANGVTHEAGDIGAGLGIDGWSKIIVNGDSDLIPSNIKKGVTIFDVAGTYEADGYTDILNYDTATTTIKNETGKELLVFIADSPLVAYNGVGQNNPEIGYISVGSNIKQSNSILVGATAKITTYRDSTIYLVECSTSGTVHTKTAYNDTYTIT